MGASKGRVARMMKRVYVVMMGAGIVERLIGHGCGTASSRRIDSSNLCNEVEVS
jgi:hypothetical protein